MSKLRLLYTLLTSLGLWSEYKANRKEYRTWGGGGIDDPACWIIDAFPWMNDAKKWDEADTKWRKLLYNEQKLKEE